MGKHKTCANCRQSHSTFYKGCPVYKKHALANKIRASRYMPKAVAFQQASNKLAEKSKLAVTESGYNKSHVSVSYQNDQDLVTSNSV